MKNEKEIDSRVIFLFLFLFASTYFLVLYFGGYPKEFLYSIIKTEKIIFLPLIGSLFGCAFMSILGAAEELYEKFSKLSLLKSIIISILLNLFFALCFYYAVNPKYSIINKDLSQVFIFLMAISIPYLIIIILKFLSKRIFKDV